MAAWGELIDGLVGCTSRTRGNGKASIPSHESTDGNESDLQDFLLRGASREAGKQKNPGYYVLRTRDFSEHKLDGGCFEHFCHEAVINIHHDSMTHTYRNGYSRGI